MVKYRNLNSVMESGDHFKNGASSKSQMSRGDIKFLLLLYALLAWCLLLNGCDKKEDDETNNNDKGDWVLINGTKWATRNLDTHGHFVAKPEDLGGLFQWGRKGDGHERRTSPSYPTNNSSVEEGIVSVPYLDANGQVVNTHAAYGKFIKNDYITSFYDWCSPQNNALWNTGSEVSPVKSANDPCPSGWRVPTPAEFEKLVNSGSIWTSQDGVYGRRFGSDSNSIFLPATGIRGGNGVINAVTFTIAAYWSSSASSYQAAALTFGDDFVSRVIGGNPRVFGSSIRCVAE